MFHSLPPVDVWEMKDYGNIQKNIRMIGHEEERHYNFKANIQATNKRVIILSRRPSL
jgi:hypothetical protein